MVCKPGVIATQDVVRLCHTTSVCTASAALLGGNMQHVEVGAVTPNMRCCSLRDAEELVKPAFIPDLAKSRWKLVNVSF